MLQPLDIEGLQFVKSTIECNSSFYTPASGKRCPFIMLLFFFSVNLWCFSQLFLDLYWPLIKPM